MDDTTSQMKGSESVELTSSDLAANASAVFYPAVNASDNDGIYAPPCIEIGGVQVYAYIRDGIFVISVNYDGADSGPDTPLRLYEDGCVATVIKAGDAEPVWEALPEDATEADARQLRDTSSGEPGSWPAFVIPSWVDNVPSVPTVIPDGHCTDAILTCPHCQDILKRNSGQAGL